MIKRTISVLAVSLVLLTSCEQEKKSDNEMDAASSVQTIEDGKGNTMALTFDNEKDIVVVDVNGETQELKREKSASGVWYKNDHYELLGKGNDYTLTKDGEKIFSNTEEVENVKVENASGDVLDLTFNNSQGTVKAYLNGGDEIQMSEEKAASGIWYKNDEYELSGKGDHYELKKGDEVIFEN